MLHCPRPEFNVATCCLELEWTDALSATIDSQSSIWSNGTQVPIILSLSAAMDIYGTTAWCRVGPYDRVLATPIASGDKLFSRYACAPLPVPVQPGTFEVSLHFEPAPGPWHTLGRRTGPLPLPYASFVSVLTPLVVLGGCPTGYRSHTGVCCDAVHLFDGDCAGCVNITGSYALIRSGVDLSLCDSLVHVGGEFSISPSVAALPPRAFSGLRSAGSVTLELARMTAEDLLPALVDAGAGIVVQVRAP